MFGIFAEGLTVSNIFYHSVVFPHDDINIVYKVSDSETLAQMQV